MTPEINTSLFDKEGFLRDLDNWSKDLATELAAKEKIELQDAHWEIIFLLREFYNEFERSPNMRALVSYFKKKLKKEDLKKKGNSIYLLELFPESPAKIGSKIAGLPKPENCL